MEPLFVALAVIAGVTLVLSAFSLQLQKWSLPSPPLALLAGVVAGPFALDLVDLDATVPEPHRFLEEAARLVLAIGLVGVALRLPRGYWRANLRWVLAIIGLGMPIMFAVAGGVLALGLGIPVLVALAVAASITPTDPVVTTPVVTGPYAGEHIPTRVREGLSVESGLNDGLGYLFVLLPVLLLVRPAGEAWGEWLAHTLLWEVLVAAGVGVGAGFLAGRLFLVADRATWSAPSSRLGFGLALGLVVLAVLRLLGTDGVLGVFCAAAVFARVISEDERETQNAQLDAATHPFMIATFVLLGTALPLDRWTEYGWLAPVALLVALVVRRLAGVWLTRPLFAPVLSRAETTFVGWFAPVGVSALLYATLAERRTGEEAVFDLVTMGIAISVVLHGLSTAPFATWLARRTGLPAGR